MLETSYQSLSTSNINIVIHKTVYEIVIISTGMCKLIMKTTLMGTQVRSKDYS